MSTRSEYEINQADWDALLEACKPVPYLVVGGIAPMSAQERANIAWEALGRKMGFRAMSVQPTGRDRFITAEAVSP